VATNEKLDAATATLDRLIKGTRPDQMTDPTPCAKWTVRDLMNHVIGGGHLFAMGFRGDPMPDASGGLPDFAGDNPPAAWDAAIADFNNALASPGAMDRMIALPGHGALPAPVILEIAGVDLLVHCWDLARATGQSYDVPEPVLSSAYESIRQMISPEMRDGDVFAAEVQVPETAPLGDKLAAFAGREP
jgi:uncharacterized protein (TIGR03086 family)